MKIFHHLAELLQGPFRKHFLFLISFYLLVLIPYFLLKISWLMGNVYIAAHCFVFAYFITLLVSLIKPDALRRVIQGILIVLAALCFAGNVYCCVELGYRLDADIIMLVLGTDIHEAKEFTSGLIPAWMILAVGGFLLLLAILGLVSRRHQMNLGKKASWLAMIGLIVCVALNLHRWDIWECGPIAFLHELTQIERTTDLKAHFSHPKVNAVPQERPTHVVLIIGESFARCHSSLYGYDKPTNPCLTAYRDSSLLFTFDSIDAPAPTTSQSIKLLMSAFGKADDMPSNSTKWYDYPTILELMMNCGYDCYWFSNQARGNKHNSTARMFADACDRSWFLQQEGGEKFNVRQDMVLVDSSYQFVRHLDPQGHHFIIYHMIGSHYNYGMRYPEEFAKFTEADYMSHPQSHQEILAMYDNSILYNDYVVSQLLNLYKDQEAIVIYLPDHGQVMYRDPKVPDYFMHGNTNDPVSYAAGVEIPFMIFASRSFQARHPETMRRLQSRQNQPKAWNADDLPFLIMDLIGVKDINGESVLSKSILD